MKRTLLVLLALSLLGVRDGRAQTPPRPYDGLWQATADVAGHPRVPFFLTFSRDAACDTAMAPDGKWLGYIEPLSLAGAVLSGHTIGVAGGRGSFESFDVTVSPDGRTAQGVWRNDGLPEQGPTSWTRVLPSVTQITVRSRTAEQLVLAVRGTNLPYVAAGRFALCGSAFIDDPQLRVTGHAADADGQTLLLTARIGPAFVDGAKTLRLNGATVPFTTGTPPAAAPEVAGVWFRDVTGARIPAASNNGQLGFARIAAGEPFVGVVEFKDRPSRDAWPVIVTVGGIPVGQTASRLAATPKIFETSGFLVGETGQTITLDAQGVRNSIVVTPPEIRIVVHAPGAVSRETLPSLTSLQPFMVDVYVPRAQAGRIGETLDVTLRTKSRGSSNTLRLSSERSGPRGAVRYSQEAPFTTQHGDGSLFAWLNNDRVDTLVLSYGGTTLEVPLFDSWQQQMTADITAVMDQLQVMYGRDLGAPGLSREAMAKLNVKLQLVKNFQQVMAYSGGALDDTGRAMIARGYFELVQRDPATLEGGSAGRPDRTFGIVATSHDENQMIANATDAARAEFRDRFIGLARDITIGTYQLITGMTGTNSLMMIFAHKDAMGRYVDNTERFLAGVDLASQGLLMAAHVAGSAKEGQLASESRDYRGRVSAAIMEEETGQAHLAGEVLFSDAPKPTPPPLIAAETRMANGEAARDAAREAARTATSATAGNAALETTVIERPPAPSAAPRPSAASSVETAVTNATANDARAARIDATVQRMRDLGINRPDLVTNAQIQVNNGLSADQATMALADRYGIPPGQLMERTGMTPEQIARGLDDVAQRGGVGDAAVRERFIRGYLGDRTPPDVSEIVNRPNPRANARPRINAPVRAADAAPDAAAAANDVTRDTTAPGRGSTATELQPPPAPPATELQPPPSSRPAPGAPSASSDDSSMLSPRLTGAARPEPTTRRVVSLTSHATEPPVLGSRGRWVSPDNREFELGPIAPAKGTEAAGNGTFADVHAIESGPHQGDVMKVLGKQDDVKEIVLDANGREVQLRAGPNQIVGDIAYGADLLKAHGIPHLDVREAVFDLDGIGEGKERYRTPYVIQERLGPKDVVAASIPKLDEAQQRAIVKLYKQLGDANIVWQDGHAGNIYLRDLSNGQWEAGILDTDRLATYGQIPSERLAGALQMPMMGPLGDVESMRGPARDDPVDAHEYNAKALESNRWIRYEDGTFVPGSRGLDPAIVREAFDLHEGLRTR